MNMLFSIALVTTTPVQHVNAFRWLRSPSSVECRKKVGNAGVWEMIVGGPATHLFFVSRCT